MELDKPNKSEPVYLIPNDNQCTCRRWIYIVAPCVWVRPVHGGYRLAHTNADYPAAEAKTGPANPAYQPLKEQTTLHLSQISS
jgi:hypothetical protein